jgi:hypothetical protein
MPCNDCPELIPNPNEGCLQPITSECVTYNGEDVICATITSGQNLNQVIEQLATNDCDLQEQIEDVINSLETFTCEDLSGCSINDLADVDVTPVSGESLVFNGTNWISQTIVLPNEFNCSDLAGCSLNNLGNVVESSPTNGEVLVFNGTNWVNQIINPSNTADNGLTKTLDNIQLGGDLIKNTTITGENFDLTLGTNSSSIDKLKSYTDSVNIRSTLFSFNESDENTQTKGFRFETNKTSIAIGTDVFNNFNIEDCFRIGNNISISDTNILPNTTPRGTYIGKNINSVNSGIGDNGYGVAIGEDISLDFFIGTAIGKDISVDNAIGGFLLGTDINISGFGLGNQSTYVFGNKVDITYSINLPQSTLVFNPSNQDIKSSSTGLASQEKIKTNDSDNRIITVFNSDEYYFFTNIANDDGWAINSDLFKVTQNYIRVPKSNGTILDEEEACVRFNTSTSKYQGYVGGIWVDFH